MGQDYYPEILGHMFIVNAPMLFSGIWAFAKAFLDEKTKKKISIIGSSYKKTLLEFIDEENLPDFLGGKSDTQMGKTLRRNVGPWNPEGLKMNEEILK